MGTTERLARWVVEFDYSQVPSKGIEQVKISVLDTLGTALVGAKQPIGKIMAEYAKECGGPQQARLIGSGTKTSAITAALANGTLAHAEDYDTTPHSGTYLLATSMALGEQFKLSGKKIIEGYAVGYEIGSKLYNLGDLETAGLHSTPLLGTIAVAAQTAKIFGLNLKQTRMAMGIAASMSCGLVQNYGTFTKPLHAGHTARCGIEAATLAGKGFTADMNIVEAKRGLFYAFGNDRSSVARVGENIGKPLLIAERGFNVKRWPNCLANHSTIIAVHRLAEKNKIKPEQIESIDAVVSYIRPGALLHDNPKCGYEGKFSLPYNIATVLIDRKVDVASYTDKKLARPEMQRLLKIITVRERDGLRDVPAKLFGEIPHWDVVVIINLKDGRVLSEREEDTDSLKGEEIYAKYRENAEFGGLTAKKTDRSISLIKDLENIKDITELMDAVTLK